MEKKLNHPSASKNSIGPEIIFVSWYDRGPKQEARLSDNSSEKDQKSGVARSKQSPKRSA